MSGGVASESGRQERSRCRFLTQAQKDLPTRFGKKANRVIVIAGLTAAGKTEASLLLSKFVGGEIVSADSMQVYRGMDIGTAKASSKERLEVVHHLIDVCDVTQEFTVVDYFHAAKTACKEILARGNTPIIVGGSGFYIHALLYGPPEGPASVPEVRQALEAEMERLGADQMFRHLENLDPQYAKSITSHDKQKIVRALEIISVSGKLVSQIPWGARPHIPDFDFCCWFLHRPRETLYRRIESRCERMLEEGLLREVARLERKGLRKNRSAAQSIGYRQCLDYLLSTRRPEDYHSFVQQFKQASRQYAKRQLTWFRKEKNFHWIDIEQHEMELAVDMMVRDFDTRL